MPATNVLASVAKRTRRRDWGREEGWRKYQTDNVGRREIIENIWVRSYQNSQTRVAKKALLKSANI